MNETKDKIGCFGWLFIISLIFIFLIRLSNSAHEEQQQKDEATLKLEQLALERKLGEKAEEDKKLEDETKMKLTNEQIHNVPGETVDIYGVEFTISEPFETKTEPNQYDKEHIDEKVVTFDVSIENNTTEPITIESFRFTLFENGYTVHAGGVREYIDFPTQEMESYWGRDDYFQGGTINPDQKVSATRSYYISKKLSYSENHKKQGGGRYTLKIDLSPLPFLHSFEENIIMYDFNLNIDTHNNRLIFE
ncbi:DUF4352 domain-containing protein [Robertmurraya beringensis]|uniref:DUF4352 domain-containing protein n=1 Tax=Robertmurraya beringensis TaxID=641660 RepID=A0ABV6KY52_9BACI